MALSGNAVPAVVKLSTAHSEQILIDMRSEGARPNAKMPKAWEAMTAMAEGIPIMEDVPLARALYAEGRVGDFIHARTGFARLNMIKDNAAPK